MNVFFSILIPLILIFIAVMLLGMKIFFTKRRKFPNIHIGGSKALKEKGVSCATTQDREAQKKENFIDVNRVLKDIESL